MGFISSLIRRWLPRKTDENSVELEDVASSHSNNQVGNREHREQESALGGRNRETGASEEARGSSGEVVMFTDAVSDKRIAGLHPKIREEVQRLFNHANNALLTGNAKARITCGFRSVQEQTALYAKGRTASGKIVTNARGGYSVHNYGLAIDFCLIVDGKYASWEWLKDFDGDKTPDWMEFVNLFKENGYEWGGDWKSFKDRPHLQKTFGKSITELRNLKKGSDGFVIL